MQVCAGSLFSEQRNAALERVLKTIALKSIPVKFVIHFVFIMIMPDNDEMIIVMTIPDILRTWNLDQYASAFQSNCIEVDELQTLLEPEWKDVLHSLIPVPGHRMRFVKNLKELIKEGKSESIENNNNDLKQSRVNDRNENTIPSSSKSETSNLSLKNIRETSESISSKKRSRESNEPNVIRGEQLRLLLSKSATGRCILQLAKQGPSLKQDKDRNKLTEIIIEDELSKSEKISTAGFAELVDAIQHIFPEEDSDLYFIPYKYSNGRKLLAKGKLITKYYSIRKEFKALGIITQNKDQLDSETHMLHCIIYFSN